MTLIFFFLENQPHDKRWLHEENPVHSMRSRAIKRLRLTRLHLFCNDGENQQSISSKSKRDQKQIQRVANADYHMPLFIPGENKGGGMLTETIRVDHHVMCGGPHHPTRHVFSFLLYSPTTQLNETRDRKS